MNQTIFSSVNVDTGAVFGGIFIGFIVGVCTSCCYYRRKYVKIHNIPEISLDTVVI